jgi:hypothetical protein
MVLLCCAVVPHCDGALCCDAMALLGFSWSLKGPCCWAAGAVCNCGSICQVHGEHVGWEVTAADAHALHGRPTLDLLE